MNFDNLPWRSSSEGQLGGRRTRGSNFITKRRPHVINHTLTQAHTLLIPAAILTVLTIHLVYKLHPSSSCGQINNTYSAITSTITSLRVPSFHEDRDNDADANTDVSAWLARHECLQSSLRRLRGYSSYLLRLRRKYKRCRLSKPARPGSPLASQLEFSVTARVAIDGVMLYLLSVSGIGRGTFVEVDATHGDKIISSLFASCYAYGTLSGDVERSASLFLFHEAWTGYASACQLYSNVRDVNLGVIDAGRVFGNYANLFRGQMIAGNIDVAALFNRGGDELMLLSTFSNESKFGGVEKESWIRPRFVILCYEDYWGLSHRWRVSNKSMTAINTDRDDRLAGASLPALLKLAHAALYRLVWCLASAPVVILSDAHESADIPKDILPTLSARECLQLRDSESWRKDAERLWDDAQDYEWHSE